MARWVIIFATAALMVGILLMLVDPDPALALVLESLALALGIYAYMAEGGDAGCSAASTSSRSGI